MSLNVSNGNTSTQTTDATPVNVTNFSVGSDRIVRVEVKYFAQNINDRTKLFSGFLNTYFERNSGGFQRVLSNNNEALFGDEINTFAVAPSIELVANTGTNEIDLNIVGVASTTIDWDFAFSTYTQS